MTPANLLRDQAILRQLLLARLQAGFGRELNSLFAEMAAEIERRLNGRPLTEYQARRLAEQIRGIIAEVKIRPPNMDDLAAIEARATAASLGLIGVEAALPPTAALSTIAGSSLIEGATMQQWFAKLESDTRFAIDRTIRAGVGLGRTNQEIARDILGINAQGDRGAEPLKKARRDAMAITRTGVNQVATDARLATFEANSDVISGVVQVSTLDGRTSETCMAYAGKVWSLPDYQPVDHSLPFNGGTPRHWNCRSTLAPVTKTFRELGIDQDELTPSTRASAFGQVPDNVSFDEWLKSQPVELADDMLGKGKAELWRDGKITLSQLVDGRGSPLTLTELRNRVE